MNVAQDEKNLRENRWFNAIKKFRIHRKRQWIDFQSDLILAKRRQRLCGKSGRRKPVAMYTWRCCCCCWRCWWWKEELRNWQGSRRKIEKEICWKAERRTKNAKANATKRGKEQRRKIEINSRKKVLNKENSNNGLSSSKLNSFALLFLFKKNESSQNDGNRDISNNSGTRRIGEWINTGVYVWPSSIYVCKANQKWWW